MYRKKSRQEIMSFYMKNPEKCFGAGKIDKALNYDPGGTEYGHHKHWHTHFILNELVTEGLLKKCFKKGFCLND